jgi:glycosyltransferase involved in cell wall biosynthesis
MRILQIITTLGQGGAEKLVVDLVLSSNKKMDVLLLDNSVGIHENTLIQHDINIIKPVTQRHFFSLSNYFFLYKHIKKYDVIHVHLVQGLYWCTLLSLFVSRKYIYTEHSTYNRRRKYVFFRTIEKFVYSRYTHIVCVSDLVAVQLKYWLRKDCRKIKVIKNGINLNAYFNAQGYNKTEFQNCGKDDIFLVMVARFSMAKDQPTLIKSLSLLPEKYKLLLLGSGEREGEYKELTKELNLSERVIFLGFRTDVPNILKTANICVLSSHWEGMPLSAIESMASGRPLIASNVNGITEIVSGVGVLFEHEDHIDLTSKILEISSNNELYNEVAMKCLNRAKEFDINNVLDRYYKLYNG